MHMPSTNHVLDSFSCYNKLPHTQWLKISFIILPQQQQESVEAPAESYKSSRANKTTKILKIKLCLVLQPQSRPGSMCQIEREWQPATVKDLNRMSDTQLKIISHIKNQEKYKLIEKDN